MTITDRPFAPPIERTIDLPFPPSVNRIWRAQRRPNGKMVALSGEYIAWKTQADRLAIARKSCVGAARINGPFEAHISLDQDRGNGGDLDNRIKAVLDWAQSRELIENDRYCMRLTIEWVETRRAPDGCRLVLHGLETPVRSALCMSHGMVVRASA